MSKPDYAATGKNATARWGTKAPGDLSMTQRKNMPRKTKRSARRLGFTATEMRSQVCNGVRHNQLSECSNHRSDGA